MENYRGGNGWELQSLKMVLARRERLNRPSGTFVSSGFFPGAALRPRTAGELRAGLITIAPPALEIRRNGGDRTHRMVREFLVVASEKRRQGWRRYAALLVAAASGAEEAASSSHFTETSLETPGSYMVTP